jgi:transposase
MAKRKYKIDEEQEKELLAAYQLCKDGSTKIRYQAVRMYGLSYPVKEIQHITNCSRTSLMEWVQAYREQGTPGLVDKRAGGNSAKLSRLQIEDLSNRLHSTTPEQILGIKAVSATGQFWTISDLYQAINRWYGVQYRSKNALLRLFRECGFSYHRPERVYKSRRESQVMEFQEQLEKN